MSKRDLVPVQIDSKRIRQRFLVRYYYIHFLRRFTEPATSTDGLTWGWLGVFGVELILRWGIYYVRGLKGGHCWVWFLQSCQYFDLTLPFVTCCLIQCWRSKTSHRHSRRHHWYSNTLTLSVYTISKRIMNFFCQKSTYFSCKVYVHPYNQCVLIHY